MSKKEIKDLLSAHKIKPSKGLGQNFLTNDAILEKIIAAADIKENDFVLEIGPGAGNLTRKIAREAKRIVCIEKDSRICQVLRETLKDLKNVEIIEGDALKTAPPKDTYYKVVANLPYYIASPLIRKFLECENPPQEMILMLQKEVARRICAKPPDMNLLAASVQFYASPKILFYVSKKSFWPQPKVDGAIIRILPINTNKKQVSPDLFFKIIKAGFSQPRKQLANNLAAGLGLDKEAIKKWLLKNGIQSGQRAETLAISDWLKLINTLELTFPLTF